MGSLKYTARSLPSYKIISISCLISALMVLAPLFSWAQTPGLGGNASGLQATLEHVYQAMIVHCSELIHISQGIAAFGALWSLAKIGFTSLANGKPLDFLAMLRPFTIGLTIVFFPQVIAMINGVMSPTVSGTAALVQDSDQAVATLLQQRQQMITGSTDWQMYVGQDGNGSLQAWEDKSGEADSGAFSGISNRLKFEMARASYNMRNSVKAWLSEILQHLFEAAALCINTVRTFYLIILAIFGPLAFGISVFPGFSVITGQWFSRYINIFLWLPVTNIFGSLISQIQQELIRIDIQQYATTGQTSFGPTDTAYIIFLLLSIVGYFTVPSITNYIVQAGSRAVNLARPKQN